MNMLADFHFLRPWWLLALVLLPLAGLAWRHVRGEAGNWKSMVDEHLLPHLVDATLERSRSSGAWLAGLVWVLACIALAGPAWEREPMPLYRNQAARILALELAPTMLAGDIKPTRLERARYKLNDILESSRDMQTALIGYSGDAFVAAPLTDDVNTVRNLIDALDPGVMPVVGNAPERAIAEALKLMKQAGLKQAELILLADSSSAKALAAARAASSDGLKISVLGVGSSSGAPVPLPQGGFLQDAKGNIVLPRLDESALRALASAGGGRYASMTTDRSDLGALLSTDATRQDSADLDKGRALSDRFRDRGPWLLILLLPLAVLGFRRGWLMALALTFIVPSPPAQAFEFTDLWLRPDQQAARALAQGDAKHAQALAKDPALRGTAAYRAEDYATASEAWARASGADALYNEGNALAKAGKYEEAITAYQQALEMDPKLDDAQANKQAVEDWLKQQQSKEQKNQQNNDKQQDKQDQQQSGQQQDKQDQQQGQDGQQKPEDSQQGENGSKDQQDQNQQSDSKQDQSNEADKDPSRQDKADQQKDSQAESGDEQKNPVDAEKSAAEQASDQQQRDQQQKQLSKAIDQALDDKKDSEQKKAAVASPEDEANREQQQALQQWLQRVPDDPGGLLRRKFQLEYDRRQRDEGGN
jgi:Ca-activated chloride channel homolog